MSRSSKARDAVDETFLIAWRRLAELPDEVLPWLLVTARNTMADQSRRGQRQDVIAMEVARCVHDMQPSPDVEVVERFAVLGALAQVSDRDREVLMLAVWDGLSNREAAAVAGCSVASFAVRLHRARRRLATALDEQDHWPDSDEAVELASSRLLRIDAPTAYHQIPGEEQR